MTVIALTATAIASSCGVGVTHAQASDANAPSETLCAEMPDGIGLYPGNPVTQMGFPVGKVESVVSRGDHVEVVFTTEGGRVFPADVQAVTRSKSILADRSLELVGNYESGPTLEPESCIPLRNSHTPKTISEVVGSAADFIEALSPEGGDDTVEMAVTGLNESLRGQGPNARAMMEHAADAMENPDRFVADIGSSINNMAPLTENALAEWGAIKGIVANMPDVVDAGIDLWPGTIDVCVGIGWLVAFLDDIQNTYGDEIWPFVHGQATDAIALAAGRSGDVADLVSTPTVMKGAVDQQTAQAGPLTAGFTPPAISLNDEEAERLCALLESLSPGSCHRAGSGTAVTEDGLLGLLDPNGATR
ncbi:MlaD family protein [Rhodococcus zopfii]